MSTAAVTCSPVLGHSECREGGGGLNGPRLTCPRLRRGAHRWPWAGWRSHAVHSTARRAPRSCGAAAVSDGTGREAPWSLGAEAHGRRAPFPP